MQQPPQMIPVMPSFPPTNITTEQIQKVIMSVKDYVDGQMTPIILEERNFVTVGALIIGICVGEWINGVLAQHAVAESVVQYLDENKKLILAILDNQNLGKLTECAQYQAQLQKNLMYLAAIADAQPQAPTMPPQMAPHPAMQPGGYYMQHPQAAAMAQQPGLFPQKMPLQFNNPHQLQDPQQQLHQQHQAMQAQMGMRPGATNNGMHPMHTESSLGGGSSGGAPPAGDPNDARGGNKQDASNAGTTGADGQGSSAGGHRAGNREEAK